MSAYISSFDPSHFPYITTPDNSLRVVLEMFQDDGVRGEHTGVPNSGGFFGGGFFSGTEYGYTSKTVDGYAFVASGDLNYYFPPFSGAKMAGATPHTLWGTLESVTLGAGVDKAGHVVDPFITFTFDTPLHGDLADGRGNVTHDIIWGLMNGSVEGADDRLGSGTHGGLMAALEDNHLDVDMSIADLVAHNFATETDLALAV
ncbi:heme acquisition protein HasA [Achromobacter xylosoxidans]